MAQNKGIASVEVSSEAMKFIVLLEELVTEIIEVENLESAFLRLFCEMTRTLVLFFFGDS